MGSVVLGATDANAASYGRQIGLDVDHASPPTAAYIGVDDQLGITIVSTFTSQTITVFARVLLPDGTIVPNQWPIITTGTQLPQTVLQSLPEGFILSMTVVAPSSPGPGSTFVRVVLTRSPASSNQISQVLMSGYVTAFNDLSWPGSPLWPSTKGRGRIRSITGSTPAAGGEISESVPGNGIWRLISFSYILTTAVAAATRASRLILDDGTNAFATLSPAATQIASLVNTYTWGPALSPLAIGVGVIQQPTPNDCVLFGGFRIRTSTQNVQAADQYTAVQYEVEEWLNV